MLINIPTNALISGIKLTLKLLRLVSVFLRHLRGTHSLCS